MHIDELERAAWLQWESRHKTSTDSIAATTASSREALAWVENRDRIMAEAYRRQTTGLRYCCGGIYADLEA